MLKTIEALLFVSFLCLAMFSFGQASAQEPAPAQDKINRLEFGDGVFEDVAAKMELLFELEWKGESIALVRDWGKQKKKKSDGNNEDQELKEAMESLVERGVPADQAEKMAKHMQAHGPLSGGLDRSGVEKAFFAIPSGLAGKSSRSRGTAERKQLSFSSVGLSGAGILAKENVRFEFVENDSPERSFELQDTGDGKVQFTFSYDQLFVRFLQAKNGEIQLIWINKDQAKVFAADTFADFVIEHPRPAEKLLFPLFEQLGIKMPLDKMNP